MTTKIRSGGRWLVSLAIMACLAAPLAAQSVLRVERDGKLCTVRKVVGLRAFVEDNGKLVPASGSRCVLQPVEEFLPVFVAVTHVQVKTSHLNMVGSGMSMNNEFHFKATFESPYALDDVFLVLELKTERLGTVLFYYEVGNLEPNRTRTSSVNIPLSERIGEGHYKLHLFTGGAEVFQSLQPVQLREGKLDRMVARRIAGVSAADPKPLVGPPPEYPARLRKKNPRGEAVVSMHLTARGVVVNPVITSATDPAFGEAALAAVSQWRFTPEVRDGRAVETNVTMPFVFPPRVAGED